MKIGSNTVAGMVGDFKVKNLNWNQFNEMINEIKEIFLNPITHGGGGPYWPNRFSAAGSKEIQRHRMKVFNINEVGFGEGLGVNSLDLDKPTYQILASHQT